MSKAVTRDSGGFALGQGGTGPQIVARPPNLAVLLTHCGQLILRKISKFDATRCQIYGQNAQNSISAGLRLTPRWGGGCSPRLPYYLMKIFYSTQDAIPSI